MTANHSPGCPAIADPRDGCSCLLRGVAAQEEHLPGCEPRIRLMGFDPDGDETCFTCRALRACEARVRADERVVVLSGEPFVKAYAAGQRAALNAATEAVADDLSDTTDGTEYDEGYVAGRDRALAAIAALKGAET